jgi:ABC-type glycerol-3-phosphate transport system permease component
MASRRRRAVLAQVPRYLLMILIGLLMFLPIYWLLISSVQPAKTIFKFTRDITWDTFFPRVLTWENYQYIFTPPSNFPRALFNTLFVGTTTAVFGLLINSLAGFAFAIFDFKGKNVLFAIVLVTFMMPFESIVIPLYVLIKGMGLFDTYQALIFPALANGLIIFLFRQFLSGIPRGLFEAALVDGATWLQVYYRIALPLAWPVIVTALLMMFNQIWESFFWPLVAAPTPEHVLIQIEIVRNINFDEAIWGRLFASSAVATLVPMVLFLSMQKYYVRSIVSSAFK